MENNFLDRLDVFLKKQNWTASKFAKESGINKSAVTHWKVRGMKQERHWHKFLDLLEHKLNNN